MTRALSPERRILSQVISTTDMPSETESN